MKLLGQFIITVVIVSILGSIIIFFDKRMMEGLAKDHQSQNEQK